MDLSSIFDLFTPTNHAVHIRIFSPTTTRLFFTNDRLKRLHSPRWTVSHVSLDYGPLPNESQRDKMSAPVEMINAAVQAKTDGVDALVICCIDDPGLIAVQKAVKILVVSVPQISVAIPAEYNHRFGALVLDWIAPMVEDIAAKYSKEGLYVGCRPVDISACGTQIRSEDVQDLLNKAALELVQGEGKPEVIILSCGSFLGCGNGIKNYLSARGIKMEVLDPMYNAVSAAHYSISLIKSGKAELPRQYYDP